MRRISRWLIIGVTLIVAFGLAVPVSGAATPRPTANPGSAASINGEQTRTNQTVWVHQCAQMSCGYHVVGQGITVWGFCRTRNENIDWVLIVTLAPWNSGLRIAGFVEQRALDIPLPAVGCAGVGRATGGLRGETWARSCPAMSCGFGYMYPGTDVAGICHTNSSEDGSRWYLILDHGNSLRDLSGFTPESNYPNRPGFPAPTDMC